VTPIVATLLIFDGRGNLAWFQPDPKAADARLAIVIWERLANQ
jgi:hypothetical protein